MISDPVAIALVSGVFGVIGTYITSVVAKKVQAKKAEKQPKDRMEQMFDGYERIIEAKDREDHRKAVLIKELQQAVDRMEDELIATRTSLNTTRNELVDSNLENKELHKMLHDMREEYKRFKAEARQRVDKAESS